MKKIISFILLLGMLCLAGCKEDSQNVEFTVKEIRIDKKAQTFDVSITADCQWVIEDSNGFAVANIKFGEGSSIITVTAWRNETFEDREHTIEIHSEDGSSVDYLTIYQEANIGAKLEKPETIGAEGGVFQINVKTNDNIKHVETPDWVTFTSSRALTDYVYTFTAEPNKTGSARKGGILFTGDSSVTTTEVSQESFVPTGVKLTNAPSKTDKKNLSIPCKLVPEYADWSHISVKASDGCTAKMDGHHISLTMSSFGEYTYSVFSKWKEILTKTIVYMPGSLLPKNFRTEYAIGGKVKLPLQYNISDVKITSSNPDVVSISDGNIMNMLSEGLSTITISAPSINYSESVDIIVGKIFMVSWANSYFYIMGGAWQVDIETVIEGDNFTSHSFAIADYSQGIARKLYSEKREYPEGKNRITIRRTVEVYAKNQTDLKQRLERVISEFKGTTKDGTIGSTTGTLSQKPTWL